MPRTNFRRLTNAGPLGEHGVAELTEDAERRERQTNWVNARNAKLAQGRDRRRRRLASEEAIRGDRMASIAWSWLTGPGSVTPTPADIAILRNYVSRDGTALDEAREALSLGSLPTTPPPPMSALASDAGRSLPLHLSMLAVAELITIDGAKMINDPDRAGSSTGQTAKGGLRVHNTTQNVADWAKILGIPAVGKARTVRVHEPLRRLEALGFVSYAPGHPSKFTLLSEDGTGRPWTRPELDPLDPSFSIPFDFWRNRWYLWLTHAEISTLFTIYHAWDCAPSKVYQEGLGLPESVRRAAYDMSGERYNTIHELIEFGLIEMVSPSLRPRTARTATQVDQPGMTHHIRPVRQGLATEARGTILARLTANPLPPRMNQLPLQRVLYAAELRAAAQQSRTPTPP
jgi:hypothetical protein